MEGILTILFACCFPTSRRHSNDPERTPLLPSESSSSASITDTSNTPNTTTKRKPTSVLPSPAYDAQALSTILDDFRAKLIAVDGSAPTTLLATESIATQVEGKHVTPVHTLQRSLTGPTSTGAGKSNLVDIWSDSAASPTPAQSAILSYSAVVKRGATAGAGKKGKRFAKGSTTAAKQDVVSVEQKTYETLAELARTKPLVHDWGLEDSGEA